MILMQLSIEIRMTFLYSFLHLVVVYEIKQTIHHLEAAFHSMNYEIQTYSH